MPAWPGPRSSRHTRQVKNPRSPSRSRWPSTHAWEEDEAMPTGTPESCASDSQRRITGRGRCRAWISSRRIRRRSLVVSADRDDRSCPPARASGSKTSSVPMLACQSASARSCPWRGPQFRPRPVEGLLGVEDRPVEVEDEAGPGHGEIMAAGRRGAALLHWAPSCRSAMLSACSTISCRPTGRTCHSSGWRGSRRPRPRDSPWSPVWTAESNRWPCSGSVPETPRSSATPGAG